VEHVKKNILPYTLLSVLLFTTAIWYAVFAESRNGILTVAFLDVGQGDAIFIEAPSGSQVLIDGGPGRGVLRELSKVMPFYDRSIDIVIATHPDKDHIGGLPDVLENYAVDIFLEPGLASDTGAYRELEDIISEQDIEKVLVRRGMRLMLGGGAYLTILFPDRDVDELESNTASIVAQLIYGDTEFLLTGDSPKSIEKYLVSTLGESLESDVLKVGHHGSKTSSDVSFIGIASPQYAIISVGSNNRYGHPHEEVIDILKQFEVEVLSTYKQGTVIFKSDGENLQIQ